MKTFKFTIDSNKYEVAVQSVEEDVVNLTLNGKNYAVAVEREKTAAPVIAPVATPKPAAAAPAAAPQASAPAGAKAVKSPLPGTVLQVKVQAGQSVKRGDVIVVLESMKMENNIMAEKNGVIKSISVTAGQSIMQGDALFELEA
ncbi:MAG: biotin/lipoyl-binding protein [Bacteroidales bacterium]|nr:biotin/lipoyl-binding protein [Bacteroidales bacterium]